MSMISNSDIILNHFLYLLDNGISEITKNVCSLLYLNLSSVGVNYWITPSYCLERYCVHVLLLANGQ